MDPSVQSIYREEQAVDPRRSLKPVPPFMIVSGVDHLQLHVARPHCILRSNLEMCEPSPRAGDDPSSVIEH